MTAQHQMNTPSPVDDEARQRFGTFVSGVRPELFRYCARMAGSVFDGEDIVQDTLAKAHDALTRMTTPTSLKPWLFRIAHNTALDFLRRRERKLVELVADVPDAADTVEGEVDPELVDAALTVFVALPPTQRSALVLKDVLGHSLEQTAATMGTTVAAVKGALARARANAAASMAGGHAVSAQEPSGEDQANLRRYADLFNARNWDGLRALLGEEARLDLVSREDRRGARPTEYYSHYAVIALDEDLRAVPGLVDSAPAIAMFRPASSRVPSYFILLEWEGQRVALIRDFRYVPYIAHGARFTGT